MGERRRFQVSLHVGSEGGRESVTNLGWIAIPDDEAADLSKVAVLSLAEELRRRIDNLPPYEHRAIFGQVLEVLFMPAGAQHADVEG